METWYTYKNIHKISENHVYFLAQKFNVNVWSNDSCFETWHEQLEKKVNHKGAMK